MWALTGRSELQTSVLFLLEDGISDEHVLRWPARTNGEKEGLPSFCVCLWVFSGTLGF